MSGPLGLKRVDPKGVLRMGTSSSVADANQITEGPVLTSTGLAAVVAWNDPAYAPLLRTNPRYVGPADHLVVQRWAFSAILSGHRLAILGATALQAMLHAAS